MRNRIKEIVMLFDSHTHINDEQFSQDLDQVMARAKDMGVSRMSVVGFDYPSIEKALALSQEYPQVYPTIGWHPTEAGSYNEEVEGYLQQIYESGQAVAVGETGLDYHWMDDPKEVQFHAFRRQIQLAKDYELPVTVHNRESTKDVYRILEEEGLPQAGLIMHSFNVSTRWLKRFVKLGAMISISGVVTFKNAPEVRDIAQATPLDRLMVETDAPYLSPEPNRGKRNEPGYVRFVAEEIAKVKGLSVQELAQVTYDNTNRIFKLNE